MPTPKSSVPFDSHCFTDYVEECRNYLLLVANQELTPKLSAKVGASDIVQDVMFAAVRSRDSFRGRSKDDLLSWLRAMLINRMRDVYRRYHDAAKRDIRLEQGIEQTTDSAAMTHANVSSVEPSPSQHAVIREERELLAKAMRHLSKRHQLVIVMRNKLGLSFREIGGHLRITDSAARQLWTRAIRCLERVISQTK